jgi:predicted HNH restriction endonuclease
MHGVIDNQVPERLSEAAHKAWRTRRARKAVETREKNVLHTKLSRAAKREVKKRKDIQGEVAAYLKKWWRTEYVDNSHSKVKPFKCEVCGDSQRLGLNIHHIDPSIKKGDTRFNSLRNQAPICGTCHNIITYKKTSNPDEIIEALKSRHKIALKNGLLEQ